jgi:LmbE family N-acetylglucosaminyl deacetylase
MMILLPVVAAAALDLSRILWVGAHSDDESLVAPLIAQRCTHGSTCAMLVMTEGENGSCDRVASCDQLGNVRAAEMRRAANHFRAQLTQWTLPDAYGDVATQWGHDAVVADLAQVIRDFAPTAILTFDPAHGSSCHPAHRYTGQLVVDAAGATPVWFVETAVQGYVFSNALAGAPDELEFPVAHDWRWLILDVKTHHSQFSAADVKAIESVPVEQRRVWLLPSTASRGTMFVQCP